MLSRASTLTNMRLITMMVMLTRTTTGLTLSGKMNYKKIDWGQGLPKLQLNPSASDIEAWNRQTSLTASAAIGSNFITKSSSNTPSSPVNVPLGVRNSSGGSGNSTTKGRSWSRKPYSS